MDFLIGGLAGMVATFFTHPIDVVKTRMHLQGELETREQMIRKYGGVIRSMYVIAKTDGLMALQQGLAPNLALGFFLNGLRLGVYRLAEKHGLMLNADNELSFPKTVFWSSFAGGTSAAVTCPIFVVKTRLQAMASPHIAVGKQQHHYKGAWHAFRSIYKREGVRGLFVGLDTTIARLTIGSGTQLTTFSYAKTALLQSEIVDPNSKFTLAFLSSCLTGVVVTAVACPLDVINVRLSNQGITSKGGILYNGVLDCIVKILKIEGVGGFYKGVWISYVRMAPHTTISLVMWDILTTAQKNNA